MICNQEISNYFFQTVTNFAELIGKISDNSISLLRFDVLLLYLKNKNKTIRFSP